MEDNVILELNNVYKYFPIKDGIIQKTIGYTKAVDGVNLSLKQGKTLGLVGESGSGKSTIASMIVGLAQASSGTIMYQGKDITHYSKKNWKSIRTDIQIVFQNPYASLNPRKPIYDILKDPMLVHHVVDQSNLQQRLHELMDMVQMPYDALMKYPHEFSGGQRQRLGIAKALSLNPKVLICDEPTSALDVSIQAQVLNLLKQLQSQLHLTILFIGHGLGAINYIADDIAVMVQGKIVEYGTTESIFTSPVHTYTKALLNAYPPIDPLIARTREPLLKEELRSNTILGSGGEFRKSVERMLHQPVAPLVKVEGKDQHYVSLERKDV